MESRARDFAPETYKEAVEDYVQRHQIGKRGNSTAGEVKRVFLKEGANWHDRPVGEITAPEVGELLDAIRDGLPAEGDQPATEPRPYFANRMFAYARTFFDCAHRRACRRFRNLRPPAW